MEHLEVTIGVAEGSDRPTSDVLIESDGFAILVVKEVDFGQAHEHGVAIAQGKLRFDAAADDLFWRDAVDAFYPKGA